MKKLNHKNVVRYFDWFEDQRYHCIIMELLEGTSFVNIISSKGYLSETVTK
jgi:serine/threonine protein kinase